MKKFPVMFAISLLLFPLLSLAEENKEVNKTKSNQYTTCYIMMRVADKIFEDKYQKIPIENSYFYNYDKLAKDYNISATSINSSKKITEVIYSLPFEKRLLERRKQIEMVENLIVSSCSWSFVL